MQETASALIASSRAEHTDPWRTWDLVAEVPGGYRLAFGGRIE